MRKKFKYYFIILLLLLFPTKSFSNEDVYWSNYQSGPFSIEAAKRQFGNRLLDAIEGLWFDDGLGTVQIIRDNLNKDKYKMFIIDIGYSNSKDLNGTWEATFFNQDKNYAKYSFFTRVWYDKKNGRTYKTQSGYAQIDAGTNFGNLFMDYDQRSLQGREMDHNFRRVWPANYEEYNKKILRSTSSNTKKNNEKVFFNGENYKKRTSTDYKTKSGGKRDCTEFYSKKYYYYFCESPERISYTKEFLQNDTQYNSNELLRYVYFKNGKGDVAYKGLRKYENNEVIIRGGWIDDKGVFYGVVNENTNKWIAYYEGGNTYSSETGLSTTEVKKLVNESKKYFNDALQVKRDVEKLLGKQVVNTKVETSKLKKIKKQKSQTNFKQYWWVVVLIAVGAFFVYMHTTKDLPKGKKVAKKTSKSPGAIKKFFNGDVDLTTSFWGVYFGAGLVLGLLSFAIEKNETLAGLYALFILLPFTIYAMIGTWRSANKYKIEKQKKKEGTGWGTAAQVYIALSVFRGVVEIIKEFN